jgi:hypothetical protein
MMRRGSLEPWCAIIGVLDGSSRCCNFCHYSGAYISSCHFPASDLRFHGLLCAPVAFQRRPPIGNRLGQRVVSSLKVSCWPFVWLGYPQSRLEPQASRFPVRPPASSTYTQVSPSDKANRVPKPTLRNPTWTITSPLRDPETLLVEWLFQSYITFTTRRSSSPPNIGVRASLSRYSITSPILFSEHSSLEHFQLFCKS